MFPLVHRTDRGSAISSCPVRYENDPADLGKRLAEHDLMALLDKVSDGESVSLDVSRSEALVGLHHQHWLF
jgi:hypothetical protein